MLSKLPYPPRNDIASFLKILRAMKRGIDSADLESKLGGALILIGTIELQSYSLAVEVENTINHTLKEKKFSIIENKNSKTNFEATLSTLKRYKFIHSKEIILLLEKIKDQRNKLFHGLVNMSETDSEGKIKNIINDCKRLAPLIQESLGYCYKQILV